MARGELPQSVGVALRDAMECARPWLAPPGAAVATLAHALYADWYAALHSHKALELPPDAPPFIAMLRASHAGTLTWERGWRADRVSTTGRAVATNASEERLLDPVDCVSEERPGLLPRPGTSISVRARRDSIDLLPDFWVAHSAAWAGEPGPHLRLYWNVTPAGAPMLVRELTEALGPDVRWSLKMPSSPALFARSDAAVLYLDDGEFASARAALRRVHEALSPGLLPEVPRLTHALGRGLGIAEDGGRSDESFGTHRCRLIAEAFTSATARERARPGALLGRVRGRFADAGLSIVAPHLRDGGARDYVL